MANPIASVDGVTIKTPSIYKWGLQDVSDSNAGRTEDTIMHKNKIGQKRKLELSWSGLSLAEVSAILSLFNREYISVNYLDALDGQYETRTFYVGDRTAPLYNATLNIWESLSFNIIEQ